MKVYFIAGLGADCRVFRHIRLPEGFEAVHLDWIKPLKGESLHEYGMRLAERIDTSEPFAMVGLSMGGMLSIEIAKQHHPIVTILISSVPCSRHLPGYFKVAGKLKLHRIVPVSLLKKASIIKRFFTAEKDEDKKLLRQLIDETDPAFVSWALDAVVKWQCEAFDGHYIQIHGRKDFILPIRFTKPTHVITSAGHLMVMTKAPEINRIITETLLTSVAAVHK
ncbi:MAG TPA: alpha/beta hydrolase [Chitinophagaceae bacterium]|nr:alpha/beta hydrolase [Chitinophagaceae bacterium]